MSAGVWRSTLRLGILDPPHLVLAQIAFIHQLADFPLAQVVETLVYRDFVDPGDQGAAEIEVLEGEVDLRKYLLGNVFHVVALADDAVDDGKHLGLVAFHDFAERRLIAGLRPANQGTFRGILVIHSRFRRTLDAETGECQERQSVFPYTVSDAPRRFRVSST